MKQRIPHKRLAERLGFEPRVGLPTAVFKTAGLNRSPIFPQGLALPTRLELYRKRYKQGWS